MDGASAIDRLGLNGDFTGGDRATYIEVGNRGADDYRQVLTTNVRIKIKDAGATQSQGRQVRTRFKDVSTTGNGEATGTILSAGSDWTSVRITRYCNSDVAIGQYC